MSTTTLSIITHKYPDRLTLTVAELAPLLSLSAVYIRREVRHGRFPVRWVRHGQKILFPIAAISEYLSGDTPPTQPRRVGRPTKAEQMARQQAGIAR